MHLEFTLIYQKLCNLDLKSLDRMETFWLNLICQSEVI